MVCNGGDARIGLSKDRDIVLVWLNELQEHSPLACERRRSGVALKEITGSL